MESGVIWEKIREGDEKAFEELYKNLYAPLCYVALKIINDRHSAEEIVQDVFSKIWFNREIIEVHTSLNSYLFRSVKNSSINELKRRQTEKESIIRTTSYEIWKVLLDTSESNDFIIEQLISNDTQKEVSRAIEALPDHCRQVFVLSRIENKSNDEIASLLNLSKNTVKSHLMNALKKISAVIRKEK